METKEKKIYDLESEFNKLTIETKKKIYDLESEFNKLIMQLLTKLEKQHGTNGAVITLLRRIRIARAEYHGMLLMLAGPKFYGYKKQIINRDEGFFKHMDNLTEIKELKEDLRKKKISKEDKENAEMVITLFGLIREEFDSLNPEEKEELKDRIVNLLEIYLEYLVLMKK